MAKKVGWVYGLKVLFSGGNEKQYTGSTTRSVSQRVSEHKSYSKNHDTRHYTGKAKRVSYAGSFWSSNPRKAERTVKQKRREGRWSW